MAAQVTLRIDIPEPITNAEQSQSEEAVKFHQFVLFGYATSQCLPTGGFRWLNELERSELNLEDYRDDSEEGLILEVDLEYPPELRGFHNVFPLAPEQLRYKMKCCRIIASSSKSNLLLQLDKYTS